METNPTTDSVEVKVNPKNVKLPAKLGYIFNSLVEHLRLSKGKPLGRGWKNYGPYKQKGPNCYHCHLNRDYVAAWIIKKEGDKTICEIVYAGTREKIPKK